MMRLGLAYDDVLLVPQYSEIESRQNVNTEVEICTFFKRSVDYKNFMHPIVVANMSSLMSLDMSEAIMKSGGLAIDHRFENNDQLENFKTLSTNLSFDAQHYYAISVGVSEEDKKLANKFAEYGGTIVCLDIAHGDSRHGVAMTKYLKDMFPLVIAGNVCTEGGAKRLWDAGADIIKAGLGSGSLCSTRLVTGNGVPQFTAISDIYEYLEKYSIKDKYIMADGGAKYPGDLVKALTKSHMVMTGNLFAGSKETPGTELIENGISYKLYSGSSTHKDSHVEGVRSLVKSKGSYQEILTTLLEGIRSGCSYQGVRNLTDLRENPQFIQVTGAGQIESAPHNLDKILK